VPKMLLRSFSISEGARRGRDQVHVLDKSSSKTFTANIRNVAAAFEFYEAKVEGRVVNAEAMLSELESHASAALRKLLSAESVAGNVVPNDLRGDRQGSPRARGTAGASRS